LQRIHSMRLGAGPRIPLYGGANACACRRLGPSGSGRFYAPAILAEFSLAAGAVLQMVRQQADTPALPEDESGLAEKAA
jgi:hypothetical protein